MVVVLSLFGCTCWCCINDIYKINQAQNLANVSPPKHQIQYNSRLISVDNFQIIYSDVNSFPPNEILTLARPQMSKKTGQKNCGKN